LLLVGYQLPEEVVCEGFGRQLIAFALNSNVTLSFVNFFHLFFFSLGELLPSLKTSALAADDASRRIL
jgi:hypothetical protein